MADRMDFELWLKSKWDGDAMKAAQHSFDETTKKAKQTDDSLKSAGYSADGLKNALTGLVAAGAVWQQFKEGFEQVAALEQAMNQLARATARFGDKSDVVKGQIVGMANALKNAAGVDDDAAIRGMIDLYNATGDVANATQIARLAADVFASGTMPTYEAALQAVTSAAQGKTRALVALKLAKDDDSAATLTAQQALDRIEESFGGAAAKAKGLKVEIDRLKEGWEDVRNEMVERVTPSLEVAVKLVISFFAALDGAFRIVADAFVGTLGVLGKFGSYMKALLTGDMDGMKDAVVAMKQEAKGAQESMVAGAKETSEKLKDIWAGVRKETTVETGKVKAIGGGGGGPDKKKEKERDLTYEEWYAMEVSKLQQEMYAEARKAEEKRLAYEKKLREDGLKHGRAVYEKSVDDAEQAAFARAKLQADEIKKEMALREQQAAAEKQMAEDTLAMLGGALSTLFGDTKEVAIAEAIINTYLGATKALAQGGIWGVVQAAIVIAAGLAHVAKIQSTEPSTEGAGFDVPAYDAAARAGGRRWAMDMIGEFSGGVREGWAEGMGSMGARSTDNSRTYNIHFHGAGFLDPAMVSNAKKLKRSLDVIDRQIDSQRTIARGRRS